MSVLPPGCWVESGGGSLCSECWLQLCKDEEVIKQHEVNAGNDGKKKKDIFCFVKKSPCKTHALMMGTC